MAKVLFTPLPPLLMAVGLRHHGWEATRGAAFVPLARCGVMKRYPSGFFGPLDHQSLLLSPLAGPPLCLEQLQERRLAFHDPGLQFPGEDSFGRIQQQATMIGTVMLMITTVNTVVQTYVEVTKFV